MPLHFFVTAAGAQNIIIFLFNKIIKKVLTFIFVGSIIIYIKEVVL
jgi:hypothetical protein